MPDRTCSGFRVTGDPSGIARFRRLMLRTVARGDERGPAPFRLETIVDFARILPAWVEDRRRAREGRGCSDRDDDPMDFALALETEELLDFRSTIAWELPAPVLEALAAAFPGLTFECTASAEKDAFGPDERSDGLGPRGLRKIDWSSIASWLADYDDDLPF